MSEIKLLLGRACGCAYGGAVDDVSSTGGGPTTTTTTNDNNEKGLRVASSVRACVLRPREGSIASSFSRIFSFACLFVCCVCLSEYSLAFPVWSSPGFGFCRRRQCTKKMAGTVRCGSLETCSYLFVRLVFSFLFSCFGPPTAGTHIRKKKAGAVCVEKNISVQDCCCLLWWDCVSCIQRKVELEQRSPRTRRKARTEQPRNLSTNAYTHVHTYTHTHSRLAR